MSALNTYLFTVRGYRQSKQRGFTLVEMMVIIAIIGILSAVAAPNIDSALQRQRTKQSAEAVVLALKDAKTESLLRRRDVVFAVRSNQIELSQGGSIIRVYSIHNKAPIEINNNQTSITFKATKNATSASVSVYCSADKATKGATILVDASGNITSGGRIQC